MFSKALQRFLVFLTRRLKSNFKQYFLDVVMVMLSMMVYYAGNTRKFFGKVGKYQKALIFGNFRNWIPVFKP